MELYRYTAVLPQIRQYRRIEIIEVSSAGGPLVVSEGRAMPLTETYMKAAEDYGWKIIDCIGEDQEGLMIIPIRVRKGVRSSTWLEFLGKTADKEKHMSWRSHVTKVVIKDKKAKDVYVIRDGRKFFVKARKEVILSAGVIGSPKILMLNRV